MSHDPQPEARRVPVEPPMPAYKGEPLDAERGPGLGCFWSQVALLALLLVATPISVVAGAPPWLSGAMLIATLVLLLFAGQTVIFLLRLVAADRRSRRRPVAPGARRTVGMIEEEEAAAGVGEPRCDEPRDDEPRDGGQRDDKSRKVES